MLFPSTTRPESSSTFQPREGSWACALLLALLALCTLAAGAASAAWAVSFAPRVDYAIGAYPSSVAIGDLNGDGTLDLVAANTNSDSVSVRLGDGAGGFGTMTEFATGDNPYMVAIADLNQDGTPDLVVTNNSSSTVSVLLGDGAGGFGLKTDIATGNYPYTVGIGDLNADGKADLAVACAGPGAVSVLLGDGAGGFGEATDLVVGSWTFSVVIGDASGDGRLDLVATNVYSNTVSVLLGDGAGGFGPKTDYMTGNLPHQAAMEDLNGDGKLDLTVVNLGDGTVSVLLGDGAGGFGVKTDFAVGDSPRSVAIGDVDGDGERDLVATNNGSNTVSVLLGDGAGGVGTKTDFATGESPFWVAIGDVNRDGRPDLVVANSVANTVSVFLNTTPFPSFGTLDLRSALLTVGPGTRPATRKTALPLELKVFTRTPSMPVDPQSYAATWASGPGLTPPDCVIADQGAIPFGGGTVEDYLVRLPAGASYFVVGKATVLEGGIPTSVYAGCRTDTLLANTTTQCYVQVIVNAGGRHQPAQTTSLKGSLLLITEPECLEFETSQELLPIIYESVVGAWKVSTSADPPEGFVSIPGMLSASVSDSNIQTLQFTVTDVGSRWTQTRITHRIRHNAREIHLISQAKMINRQSRRASGAGALAARAWDAEGGPASGVLRLDVPDPLGEMTQIRFELPVASVAMIRVYDVAGRVVATPVARAVFPAGRSSVSFDAKGLTPGIYWCRLTAGPQSALRRMVVLR